MDAIADVMRRRLGLASRWATVCVGCVLAAPAAASAQAPVASFTSSPAAPLTGDVVTLDSTAAGPILLQRWDLDGDGSFDDGTEPRVTTSFRTPGRHTVRLQVIGAAGAEAVQSQVLTVANRLPVADFSYAPTPPAPGQAVVFQSTATDGEGRVVAHAWDLDGDGLFDDATGTSATHAFAGPGDYTVGLQAVDDHGGVSAVTRTLSVLEPPPAMLSPFPVVRLFGSRTAAGLRVLDLSVRAPEGSSVEMRCGGPGCPRGRVAMRTDVPAGLPASTRVIRFRGVKRRLRSGAVLKLLVTKRGHIGKYTRFRIRRGKVPSRRDLCLAPGIERPVTCKS
jgi:hypothetical protein